MTKRIFIVSLLFLGFTSGLRAQAETFTLKARLTIPEELQLGFKSEGRLFLFLCENQRAEPRTQTWPMPWVNNHIFAINLSGLSPDKELVLDQSMDWIKTTEWDLGSVPEGAYNLQVLWDQDTEESGINAPGNLFSIKQKVVVDQSLDLEVNLDQVIEATSVTEHPQVRVVDIKSDTLSSWWGKPMHLKASVLLPRDYDENKAYPIRYNVAGYGGRYTRVNRLSANEEFMNWWNSEDAPQLISVFLDGEGPFGDSYQMDSDNSGPYGYSLINELIPHIESKYRGSDDPDTRFVDGCSTGGWVSLGLQLYYPDFFGGCFSYSPDAVEFENYQLVNIYQDENAFVTSFGLERPVMRNVNGEPFILYRRFMQYENVIGASNTYLNSGGQFSAHTALYSPKGKNGLPKGLVDPVTGVIDKEVAEHWKKYDFKLHARENWEELGPKIEGKIYIWMGDMDHFYLNTATRAFGEFLESTENPHSDAVIEFSPMEGHCSKFSNRVVLEKIKERL